jgi:hypothetical protein
MGDRVAPRHGRLRHYPATYVLAGSFSLLAAVLILLLRQPTAVPAMRPALAREASKT